MARKAKYHYKYRIYNSKMDTMSPNSYRIVWRSDQDESESEDMDRSQFEQFRRQCEIDGIEVNAEGS